MPNRSVEDTIGDWREMIEAVNRYGEELPGAAGPLRDALELHLQEAVEARDRKQLLRAGSQMATRDLCQAMAGGCDAFNRLRWLIKAAYDPRDPRLRKFGMTPIEQGFRKPRTSKGQEGKPAPGDQPE